MKALSAFLLVLALCVATVVPSSAASDKSLQNVRGTVTYQTASGGAQQPVAPNATVSLADNDTASTGPNSQAKLTLPDSSIVTIGQDSHVQMTQFDNQPNLTTAKFVVVGKVRFAVAHPSGAKASYTFTTSTGQIAVRGTVGDISISDTQLQVNCYELGDPNLPVQVTLNNGKSYTLGAGQALVVGITGAVIASAAVSAITQPLTSTFSEFGNAGTSSEAAAAVGAAAAAHVAPVAIAAAAGAAVVAGVVVGSSHGGTVTDTNPPHPTPTPSTSPTTSPTASPGQLSASPNPMTFTGPNQMQTLTVNQPHYGGAFTVIPSNGNVVVSMHTRTQFNVTSKQGGNSQLTVTGAPSTAQVTVGVTVASGAVALNPPGPLSFKDGSPPIQVKATEMGYGGTFSVSGGSSSIATVVQGPPGAFTVTPGASFGSTVFKISDLSNNFANLTVHNAPGIRPVPPSTVKLTPTQQQATFNASEPGATFSTGHSSNAASITPANGTFGTGPTLFTVSEAAQGTASAVKTPKDKTDTLTLSDGTNTYQINVTIVVTPPPTPTPSPSTTCVPIIIHARHRTAVPDATSCPSNPPAVTAPAPRGTVGPPHPHPLGPPPPVVATPKPVKNPAPRQTPPNNLPRPNIPGGGYPGMITPPPMPEPPGGHR